MFLFTKNSVDDKGRSHDDPKEATQKANGGHVSAEDELVVEVNLNANEPNGKDNLHGVFDSLSEFENAVCFLCAKN